jgi:hypothetical protein
MQSSAPPPDPLVRCGACGTVLAAEVAGLLYVQHRGRKILGRILSIVCDRCGARWLAEDAAPPPSVPTALHLVANAA